MNHPLANRLGISLFGAMVASTRKGPVACVTCGWKSRRDVYGPLFVGDPDRPDEAEEVMSLNTLGDKPCPHCGSDVVPREFAA